MMRIDGEFRNLKESQDAFERVKEIFFTPYADHIGIGGVDGVSQQRDAGRITKFLFPKGFLADRTVDVSATQHEMGHFITVPEPKCVRVGFGFNGGIPTFWGDEYDPDNKIYVSPASANSEAKAMAWEVIISRDLHNLDLDHHFIARSLRLTDDFLRYEGKNEGERIDWVANKILGYVEEFGTIDDFKRIWDERCQKLPDLIRRENLREKMRGEDPVSISRMDDIYEGWHAIIEEREKSDVQTFTVHLMKDAPEEWEEGLSIRRVFDTMKQATRWVESITAAHGHQPRTSSFSI